MDNRPEAVAQRKLQETANNSPQISQTKAFQKTSINNDQPIQRMTTEEYDELKVTWGTQTVDEALTILGQTWQQANDMDVLDEIYTLSKDFFEATKTSKDIMHGDDRNNAFRNWLLHGTPPENMNCWEYLMYIGALSGSLNREDIAKNYFEDNDDRWEMDASKVLGIFSDKGNPIDIRDTRQLSVGDAIVISEPSRHVLISLGGNNVADLGTWGGVHETTIENVMASQTRNVAMTKSHIDNIMREYINLIDSQGVNHEVIEKIERTKNEVHSFDAPDIENLESYVLAQLANNQVPWNYIDVLLRQVKTATRVTIYKIPKASWVNQLK